tara:strand:- start:342 stop:650 length:309 start_codon:yes stop_codon:yes gene_type:complete
MTTIKNFIDELEDKIKKASIGRGIKPSVLFCGCNPQLKKDMHKRAKKIGLNPSYSIKHPTIKVELKRNKKIEIDKYNTTSMDYDHFEIIYRCLENDYKKHFL